MYTLSNFLIRKIEFHISETLVCITWPGSQHFSVACCLIQIMHIYLICNGLNGFVAVDRTDPYYAAAALHFNNLMARFGAPIIMLNLVKVRPKV